MKYVLEPIHRPVDKTLLDSLGSGYVGNTHFVVWKGRYEHQLFFKDISKPEDEGWFALGESEKIDWCQFLDEIKKEQKTTEEISISSLCLCDLVNSTAYEKSKEKEHDIACKTYSEYKEKKWIPLSVFQKLCDKLKEEKK